MEHITKKGESDGEGRRKGSRKKRGEEKKGGVEREEGEESGVRGWRASTLPYAVVYVI